MSNVGPITLATFYFPGHFLGPNLDSNRSQLFKTPGLNSDSSTWTPSCRQVCSTMATKNGHKNTYSPHSHIITAHYHNFHYILLNNYIITTHYYNLHYILPNNHITTAQYYSLPHPGKQSHYHSSLLQPYIFPCNHLGKKKQQPVCNHSSLLHPPYSNHIIKAHYCILHYSPCNHIITPPTTDQHNKLLTTLTLWAACTAYNQMRTSPRWSHKLCPSAGLLVPCNHVSRCGNRSNRKLVGLADPIIHFTENSRYFETLHTVNVLWLGTANSEFFTKFEF